MLARWIDLAAARDPDAPALIVGTDTLSYRQLADKSECVARALEAQGVKAGDLVAVPGDSPLLLAILAWSLARLRAALLPLNPAWPPERRMRMLRLAAPDWVVASDDAGIGRAVAGAPLLDAWHHRGTPVPRERVAAEARALALVIATSGSEGEPKGVMLSGANLAASASAARDRMPLSPGDVWLACLPLYHVGGISILYRCAEAGAAVALVERFEGDAVRRAMAIHRVSHVSLVPPMLSRLVEAGPPPAYLRYALVGGGALSAGLMRRAVATGWPVCASYGSSETASQVATLCAPARWREGMAGPPLAGVEVDIVDEGGSPCFGPGRIRLRGPMVMMGYLTPGRAAGVGLDDGWFASGDRGSLDADGNLMVLGRQDDMLVTGGVNVHPAEAEHILSACPGVIDVAVTAMPDAVWGDRLVALVAGTASMETVRQWSVERMPGYLRPRVFLPVSELPRNAMGKLERTRLAALAASIST